RCNVEVYRDENTGLLVYVGEKGSLAVIPEGKGKLGQHAEPLAWSHALDLHARKPGEEKFGPKTATIFGVEVFQDRNRGAWVYLTETLHLAVHPDSNAGDAKAPRVDAQAAKWLHGLRPGEATALKWSAEVYHNPNTDHVVYVTVGGA